MQRTLARSGGSPDAPTPERRRSIGTSASRHDLVDRYRQDAGPAELGNRA
jgi:hypothetical protein